METTDEEVLNLKTNLPIITKQIEKPTKQYNAKRILYISDCLISLAISGPCVVGFWRSAWHIIEFHGEYFPVYPSLAIAIALHAVLLYFRPHLQKAIDTDVRKWKRGVGCVLLRRLYVYFHALINVMHWRGAFTGLDQMLGIEFGQDGRASAENATFCVSLAVLLSIGTLALLKSLRNTIAPPLVIVLDNTELLFDAPTRFRTTMMEKTSLYVLDCIFSVLIVGTLVVFVWRGAWVLLDIFLFPESAIWSAWSSLILGYTTVALAFIMQPAMRWVCDRLQGALRLFAADMFLIFSLLGTVNVWRGIWMLLNLYFIPDNLELSCWITHWVCLILLMLLGCSNSLLVRGVYIDAEEPAGKCVIFPCYYLRLIFQQERAKKIAKRLQLDVMAKRKQDIDNNLAEANHVTTISQLNAKDTNNHVV